MQKASCCCVLKEKVFRVQKFSIRWDAVRAVIQPFVRWQLLNILTKTSWHCLSFREIKWSFISFVFVPSLFTPALIDASQKRRHWSPICVRVGGWVRESVRFVFLFFCPMWFLSCTWQHRKSQPWHFAVLLPTYLTKVVHSQVKFQWKRSRQRSLSHTHQKNESRILFLQKSVTWVLNNKNQAGFWFFLIASYKSHLFWPDRWSLLTLDEGFNDKDKYQSISAMAPSFAQHRLSLGECSGARVQIRICSLIVFTEDKNGTFVLPARECIEKGKPTGKR